MNSYALTDVGKARSTNQDYIFSSSKPVGSLPCLHMVADGMGGHQAGDYASRSIVENLITYFQYAPQAPVVSLLREGISDVNRRLYQESLEDEGLYGMGSTLVAAVIEDNTLYVANIGDSRLYLVRGQIAQITRDHSYVEELVCLGQMERGSKDYLSKKNIITRAIGTDEYVEIDFFELEVRPGDYLLLCSDGLTNMVNDKQIETIIRSGLTLKEKAEALIESANAGGGRDNIAVVLIEPQISEVSIC